MRKGKNVDKSKEWKWSSYSWLKKLLKDMKKWYLWLSTVLKILETISFFTLKLMNTYIMKEKVLSV
jgi:hypothetical protein